MIARNLASLRPVLTNAGKQLDEVPQRKIWVHTQPEEPKRIATCFVEAGLGRHGGCKPAPLHDLRYNPAQG